MAFVAILSSIPLVFPHQRFYSFLFFSPAILFLFYFLSTMAVRVAKSGKIILVFSVLSILLLAPYAGRDSLGFLIDYWFDYRLFSVGAFLFYPIYFMVANRSFRSEAISWTALLVQSKSDVITISKA